MDLRQGAPSLGVFRKQFMDKKLRLEDLQKIIQFVHTSETKSYSVEGKQRKSYSIVLSQEKKSAKVRTIAVRIRATRAK